MSTCIRRSLRTLKPANLTTSLSSLSSLPDLGKSRVCFECARGQGALERDVVSWWNRIEEHAYCFLFLWLGRCGRRCFLNNKRLATSVYCIRYLSRAVVYPTGRTQNLVLSTVRYGRYGMVWDGMGWDITVLEIRKVNAQLCPARVRGAGVEDLNTACAF